MPLDSIGFSFYPQTPVIAPVAKPTPQSAIVLTDMLEFLDDGRGWTKSRLHDGDAAHCMIGALHLSRKKNGGIVGYLAAKHYLRSAIHERTHLLPTTHWFIEPFNDDRNTTWPDVRQVIERAREIAIEHG